MRIRSTALLSTLAVTGLLLAGCSGDASPEASGEPKSSSECLLDKKPGKGSDAVVVEGAGADAKVTVPEGTKIEDAERTIVKEGDGKDLHDGDLVTLRYQVVDGVTSEVLGSSERGPDGILPALLSGAQPQQLSDFTQSSVFVVAVECAPLGSQVVLTLPSSLLGDATANPLVLYVETIEKLPTVASGTDVDPTPGMPTVELDDKGEPTVTIPDADAPAATQVALLKQGDGPTVGAGDLVTVQYRGLTWDDGEEFDSSWSRDAVPAQFPTTGVVPGFRMALEGQKVGSQVIVQMTPADGYGEAGASESELAGKTLVFVVDILAATPTEQLPTQ